MAAFDSVMDSGRVDYALMMRSPVRLVHSHALLDQTSAWLRQHDYRLVEVDASWMITAHMFRDLGSALGYVCHDQWQCLHEGLCEAVVGTWGQSAGFCLVLKGFDTFTRYQSEDAHTLLEIIPEQAWHAALQGHRVICLVQTDDPNLQLRRIGMWSPTWTDAEWGQA